MENNQESSFAQLTIHRDTAGPRVVGRSSNILFDWEEEALKFVVRFGQCTEQVESHSGVFVSPMLPNGVSFVGICLIRNDGSPDLFRIAIVLHRERFEIDPWLFAKQFEQSNEKGDLETISVDKLWPINRTVDEIQSILKSGDSPLLLGSSQALIDGCKIIVNQSEVNHDFIHNLWNLLPNQSRKELSFSTIVFSVENRFDISVMPEEIRPSQGFLTAEQVRDYPEGRYELALQLAAESGDQRELDRLFARKTSSQMLKLVISMIAFAFIVIILMKLF